MLYLITYILLYFSKNFPKVNIVFLPNPHFVAPALPRLNHSMARGRIQKVNGIVSSDSAMISRKVF